MAIYLVSVGPEHIKAIAKLIERGNYTSVEQFLAVAVTNQLTYERQDAESRNAQTHMAAQKKAHAAVQIENSDLQAFALRETQVAMPDVQHNRTSQLLWGQYYRFLPLKAALRLMINSFGERPFFLHDAHKIVQDRIMTLADYLESRRAGEGLMRLDVGFPSRSRDLERSIGRFIVQYVGKCAGNGTLTGFPSMMGLLAKARPEDDCAVQFTDAAVSFAQLTNPILDGPSTLEPLAIEERRFIVKHICDALPMEASHMKLVASAIESGNNTPKKLLGALLDFYRATYSDRELSESQTTLMRSGCISRLVELGVVTSSRTGGRARYSISEEQPEIVQLVLDFDHHTPGTA